MDDGFVIASYVSGHFLSLESFRWHLFDSCCFKIGGDARSARTRYMGSYQWHGESNTGFEYERATGTSKGMSKSFQA